MFERVACERRHHPCEQSANGSGEFRSRDGVCGCDGNEQEDARECDGERGKDGCMFLQYDTNVENGLLFLWSVLLCCGCDGEQVDERLFLRGISWRESFFLQ